MWWTLITSRLGIVIISALIMAGFGFYHKAVGWKHEAQVAKLEKEKDQAIKDWINEKQKAEDLEKTVQFQRNQLARAKRVKKETSDVDKAVTSGDIDFFRRNAERLYDYKNPASQAPAAGGIRKRFKPPDQTGEVQ